MSIRLRNILTLGASITAGLVLGMVSFHSPDASSAGTSMNSDDVRIHQGFSVDVYDEHVVEENTTYSFDFTATELVGVDDFGHSTYRVIVSEVERGNVSRGEALVEQLGYVDDEGKPHLPEGQPLIEVGKSYSVAGNLSDDARSYIVFAGPHGLREILPTESG